MNEIVKRFEQADELIKSTSCLNGRDKKLFFFALSIREIGEIEVTTTIPQILKVLVHDHTYSNHDKLSYQNIIAKTQDATAIWVPMEMRRISKKAKPGVIKKVRVHLIRYADYDVNDPRQEVTFIYDEGLLPLLDDLKMRFTWINMEQARRLDGKYSLRMYEWARMMLKDGECCEWEWSLSENNNNMPCIRNFFGIEGISSYNDWRELKRRVIDPSIKEINQKVDDLKIDYTTIKIKRTIIALNMMVKAVHKTVIRKNSTTTKKVELPEWYYKEDPGKATSSMEEELKALLNTSSSASSGTQKSIEESYENDDPFNF